MNANQSNLINSLASAISWTSSSIWASQYKEMKENALDNIQRALDNIAEAESLLKQMKADLLNK